MSRPELGKVTVGDELIVIRAYNHYRDNDPLDARVIKAGRVWVELAASDGRTYRLRRDTQDDGSQYRGGDRFVTREQYTWEQQVEDARRVLRAVRIRLDGSRWDHDDRLLALAAFIHDYDEQHPEEER